MFIIPSSEVLLASAAVVLVLASLESISSIWLYTPRFTAPEGGITDEQVADHPALARTFKNRRHRVRTRRITYKSTSHTSALWVLATLAMLALLTTVLMMGIAISV